MKFSKYHALGNDYLVLDTADRTDPYTGKDCIIACHRNYGLGSDGILFGPLPCDDADFGLRIFNPDSSEAEKSGNGIRIFAKYLFDTGKVTTKPFTIRVPGGKVTCIVDAAGKCIQVEMGKVSFRSDVIPVRLTGETREVLNESITLKGREFRFAAATVGNPHAVFPMQAVSPELAREFGSLIENHPLFPNRTNVQFLQILDRKNIRIEIWERGAGYTLASGSSSSASAAVARRLGLVDADLTVHMPGGQIGIKLTDQFDVHMTGPATRVGEFHLDESCLRENVAL